MRYSSSGFTVSRATLVRIVARTVIPFGIVGGALVLLMYTSRDALRTSPKIRVTPVVLVATMARVQDTTASGILAAGWIEPAPFATEIPALRSGVVTAIHALEGDSVHAGDLLCSLSSEHEQLVLREREALLQAAEAELAVATAQRESAQLALDRGIELKQIRAEREAQLAEAEAAVRLLPDEIAETTALRNAADDERTRKEKLVETGGASLGEVTRLALRVAALDAKLHALNTEAPARAATLRTAQELLALATADEALRPAARITLTEREEQLRARVHARDAARALRDIASLAVERSEIRAAKDAVVLARRVNIGSTVGPDGEAPFILYEPTRLQVRCDVPLKDAARLAVGQAAEIRIESTRDEMYRGTVARIDPVADIQKNTVRCKIVIEQTAANAQAQPLLRPEMLVRVRIEPRSADATSATREGVAIPTRAIIDRNGSRASVWTTQPDGAVSRLVPREVELGAERAPGWIEVLSGLAAGDRVVLDTGERALLVEGSHVQPEEVLEPNSVEPSQLEPDA